MSAYSEKEDIHGQWGHKQRLGGVPGLSGGKEACTTETGSLHGQMGEGLSGIFGLRAQRQF